MLPQYWPPIPSNSYSQDNYCGVRFSAGQDQYNMTITTVSEQLPVNGPELNTPPNDSDANQWGNFGGGRVGVSSPSFVVAKPIDGESSAIGGYQGWKDPVSFYWKNGAWQCEVSGPSSSLMNDAQTLTGSFKESNELKGLQARSGKILVSDANHMTTSITWVSADDQYEYTLQYNGEIADAIKIASSFNKVK